MTIPRGNTLGRRANGKVQKVAERHRRQRVARLRRATAHELARARARVYVCGVG